MAGMRGTVKRGMGFKAKSNAARPSKKRPKPSAQGVFGVKSQFAGIGRGMKGDPRK